ncbi:osteoclast stimulatory transmembrane protein-like isoform X1 [Anguilla anguilla]|uniref:osteoclast stimulatory transmembrane protein-like isoform X1 n=1 Tax=Anguilla anguilla TaxID=7936 RepID=UPI0015AEBE01|nr:osteoclast stimulatory transmembrane protein-like isoform X1 [Anguilla anguilla]
MAQSLRFLMSSFLRKTKVALHFTWDVYCKLTPCNFKEMVGLFFLCIAIAVSTAGLLYTWMSFTLKYDPYSSLIVAVVWGSIQVLVLYLVHPFRCACTIIIPSLGTKQGRKILLSVALTMSVTSSIPNMASNVSSVVHMIQCSSKVTVQNIVNSTSMMTSTLSDMKGFFQTIPDLKQTSSILDLQERANITELQNKLRNASTEFNTKISSIQKVMNVFSIVAQTVIAVVFVFHLLGGSVVYVLRYVTEPKYDNIYLTHRLMELLKAEGVTSIPIHYKRKFVKSTGWKMTRREIERGLFSFIKIILYGLISAVIIGLDHFVFFVLTNLLEWAHKVPEIHTSITVKIKVYLDGIFGNAASFFGKRPKTMDKTYSYAFPVLPSNCEPNLHPPESSLQVTIGALYIVAFIMLLGEVYARRIRRKISASFYRDREEVRVQYLLAKMVANREGCEN